MSKIEKEAKKKTHSSACGLAFASDIDLLPHLLPKEIQQAN